MEWRGEWKGREKGREKGALKEWERLDGWGGEREGARGKGGSRE